MAKLQKFNAQKKDVLVFEWQGAENSGSDNQKEIGEVLKVNSNELEIKLEDDTILIIRFPSLGEIRTIKKT